MIRTVASTILERPMMCRGNEKPSKKRMVEKHINELSYMISTFRNTIVGVSRESKWCKLALLRNRVPIEVFALIKPFLIMPGVQDYYPSVSEHRLPVRKYLRVEAKLYRMGYANDATLGDIRKYICDSPDFCEETKQQHWRLRQFDVFSNKLHFIMRVLYLRFSSGEGLVDTVYDVENTLEYWL
jgi:hypothetical protein